MKKITLLLLWVLILSTTASAQVDLKGYSESYPEGTMDQPGKFGVIIAIPMINNAFWQTNPGSYLFNTLSSKPKFQHGRPKNFTAITTFDTAEAHFFIHGVNKTNAALYEYRVMEEFNKVLVPWTTVNQFTHALVIKQIGPQMAYLGGYSAALGKMIIVDVRKKGSEQIISSSVVGWQAIHPIIQNVYSTSELNLFLNRLSRPWDSKTLPSPKKTILPYTENSLIFCLDANIYRREQIEYALNRNNNEKTILWQINEFDNSFIWLKNLKPGKYTLHIRYTAQRGHITSYSFQIQTPWYQSTVFRIILFILIAAFIGFIIFLNLLIIQKRKARKERTKKEKLQLELKAIYAQLNPHFIFNALSSIQGLINKKDLEGANKYLADFARLMRTSLSNSEREQIALQEEVSILDTYLKLEQLRFGFAYAIEVDAGINAYDTEIPPLLLQPLIENAVKHGVSSMQAKGAIMIDIKRQVKNMLISITDNGSGFKLKDNQKGFGLKLTNERITLLNEILKGQHIELTIASKHENGARVDITFNNWLP